ncbi:MAG: aspartate--tRNA ligase [Paludibacteraceae bacterium]|nr:aspartate--tRNA ligase [Paludibacteraceae bacterium]
MYRTNTCGELRISDKGKTVTLAGWVQRVRKLGGMTFVDLRDRYGITQLAFDEAKNKELSDQAQKLGREYVIQVTGLVEERASKNSKIPTGDVEIIASELNILNTSDVPPFTIEDETDGGDDLRMKYRYLDLRRNVVRRNLELRNQLTFLVRDFLVKRNFIETETPCLINSTPEGARDFVVPSRMNPGEFYALPQSPQLFKQLLMVAGFDRYFQIVKCFRDEDLRADRQPEFTQIDCEMSFVKQPDVIGLFEELIKYVFSTIKSIDFNEPFLQMTWHDAMRLYGSDKPDMRFGMTFVEITDIVKNRDFNVFNTAAYVGGICADACASYSRKDLDALTDFVKRPQVGAAGLVYVKYNADGTFKSSVDKFYNQDDLKAWADKFNAKPGDLMLILSGSDVQKTQTQLGQLRLEMGDRLGLRDNTKYAPLWVVDFPMFEWDEESSRFKAMHHPFTSPKAEDLQYLESEPGRVRADAYDFVLNGVEVGGGSVRIHDRNLQSRVFKAIGLTEEEANSKFGWLLTAFKYGAPPHAGLAFGLDRMVSLLAGLDSIRDCIAFPKNNAGRDVMISAPSVIDQSQLDELCISLNVPEKDK